MIYTAKSGPEHRAETGRWKLKTIAKGESKPGGSLEWEPQMAAEGRISPLDGGKAAGYDWVVCFSEYYASPPMVPLASAVCGSDLWMDGVFRTRSGMGALPGGSEGRTDPGVGRAALVDLRKGRFVRS